MFPNRTGRRLPAALGALSHRDFAFFWSAALISSSANWMQQFAVPYIMWDMTASNTWVGAAAFTSLIPAVAMTPVAGVLADRFSRRKVLIVTLTVQTLTCGVYAVLWQAGELTPWRILGLNLIVGMALGVQAASWQALVPQLVPPAGLLSAIRLNSAQFTASRAIGPLTGAGLLHLVGAGAIFMANAATFALLLLVIAVVRPRAVPAAPRERIGAFLLEGLRYVRRRASLLQAIVTGFVIAYFGGAILHLAAGLASEDFGVGETGLAGLITAAGVGSVMGSVVIIAYGDGVERSRVARWGLVLYAAAPLLAAATTSYPVGLAGYFVSGVAHVCIAISMNTAIQTQVAEEMRGRALSLYVMGIFCGWPVGALVGGWIGDLVGLRVVFAANGLVLVAYLGFVVRWWDGMRSLDADGDSPDRGSKAQRGVPGRTA